MAIQKTFKIEGVISTPVEIDEDMFDDLFLKWCEEKEFEFQGTIEDKSKSK